MVYDKAKSGDPDYDDKVPAEQHMGKTVTAPDGREAIITEATGPVDAATGQHVNLDAAPAGEGDNRPAPGGVAAEASDVQTYDRDDVAPAKATKAKATRTGRD